MELISRFSEIFEDCIDYYKGIEDEAFNVTEEIRCNPSDWNNMLAHGDNMKFMKYLLKERDMQGKLRMIYIDPPFFSKATYDAAIHLKSVDDRKLSPIKYFAYDDRWQHDMTE